MIWVAIGGVGTLLGAIVGTLLINGASSWLSQLFLHDWLLVMSTALIIIIRFRPSGIVGGLGKLQPRAVPVAQDSEASDAPSVAMAEARS